MTRATTRMPDIDGMDLTITITMTIGEWRKQMRQLGPEHPSWSLAGAISSAIGHVTKATETKVALTACSEGERA